MAVSQCTPSRADSKKSMRKALKKKAKAARKALKKQFKREKRKSAAVGGVYYLRAIEDIPEIPYVNEMALVEVPVDLLEHVPLKNHERSESERLLRLERSIRNKGYSSIQPVIARVGRKGRWVVIDGGHRTTAAKKIAKEYWTNLFGPKVRTLTFLLFKTDVSYARYMGEPSPLSAEEIDALDAEYETKVRAGR